MRAEYVIEEIQRVLDVCDALEKGDYECINILKSSFMRLSHKKCYVRKNM